MTTPSPTDPVFPPDPQFVALTGWFLIALALPLAVWMALRIHDKLDARTWPQARAEIIRSELYKRGARSTDWCIKMAYRYEVGGERFVSSRNASSRMSDAGCDPSRALMQARFEQRQPGDWITIRHHPLQPERGIAHVDGLDFPDFFFPAIAVSLFAAGVHSIRSAARLRVEQAFQAADRRARMRRAAHRHTMKDTP